jgi:hypothetical protein
MPTKAGGTAASEWQIGDLLDKGSASGVSLATNATTQQDIVVAGDNELTVNASMTGSAAGDLAITVVPFAADGVTPLSNLTLSPMYPSTAVAGGGNVQQTATYDVSGYQKVRVIVQNKNAGTQTLTWSWQLAPN